MRLFKQLISPRSFYQLAGKLIPCLWTLAIILFVYGLIDGMVFAPPDYQQGDAYRIIYIHVPASAMSLFIYMAMTAASIIFLIWRIKLADIVAKVSAPLGAWFTLIVLITGSLWGKPMWGTYWVWDARLTTELILLFIYLGIIALRTAIINTDKAARATAIVTIVGAVDIPIIHYSVYWWNTLHQKSTILSFAKPTIASSMMYPLLAMLAAFLCYYVALMFMRARTEVLERERKAKWIKEIN